MSTSISIANTIATDAARANSLLSLPRNDSANVDVESERVRFWEAFGNVRWAVICLLQVRRFLVASPEDSHIEHAAIGRRLDEALYDFFRLIDEKEYAL